MRVIWCSVAGLLRESRSIQLKTAFMIQGCEVGERKKAAEVQQTQNKTYFMSSNVKPESSREVCF